MDHAICTVSAAAVRKEPSHRSEMVNQLLFGETMQVLEQKEEWLRIRSLYDDYEGWLTHHLISEIDRPVAEAEAPFVATQLTNPVQTAEGVVYAPLGSPLTGYDPHTKQLWDKSFVYQGSLENLRDDIPREFFRNKIGYLLNAPYLWGGKTFMGIDCSGFVQTIFRLLGIRIKRDAWQQAAQGSELAGLTQAREKDLAFFHNDQDRITHVGIILNENKIVHASGRVRIDLLDDKGIINHENKLRTHQLHSIRRYHQ